MKNTPSYISCTAQCCCVFALDINITGFIRFVLCVCLHVGVCVYVRVGVRVCVCFQVMMPKAASSSKSSYTPTSCLFLFFCSLISPVGNNENVPAMTNTVERTHTADCEVFPLSKSARTENCVTLVVNANQCAEVFFFFFYHVESCDGVCVGMCVFTGSKLKKKLGNGS